MLGWRAHTVDVIKAHMSYEILIWLNVIDEEPEAKSTVRVLQL